MRAFLKDFARGVLLISFFVSTLFFSAYGERVFVSPDENAAFVFAKQLASVGSFPIHESLNTTLHGLIHPRSVTVMGENLLPGSFLGIPIAAGALIMGFGDAGGLLLTPVLALLGILAFKVTIKKIFEDEALADLSALFLMAHPAYLYFSGRVMMHNVAFVDFLIFAAFFAVARPFGLKSRFAREFRRIEFFLSGIMLGIALLFRLSEIVWVLPVALGLLVVYRNNLGWRNIAASLMGFGLMLLLIAYANAWVYGSPFATGYTTHEPPAVTETTVSEAPETIVATPPFGFHPRAILRNVFDYGMRLYPWMTVMSVLGFCALSLRRFEKKKSWKTLTVVAIVVSAVLFALYGSWNIIDNPDPALLKSMISEKSSVS